MNREEKKQLVDAMNEVFKNSELVLVSLNKGLTVEESTKLRGAIRKAGVEIKVVKNRLARIALAETEYTGLSDMLKGPTVLSYGNDPVAVAKTVVDFNKTNDKLEIVGAVFNGQVLDINGIKTLASLPSMDELRAKIISIIQTPATRIAGVVQAPAGQLARVFGAYAKA
ncbi:MAG: 50S ribosomal protein L10 [Alphaproteobacteria bacterium ADurb.Bin438]|nr:MAG: 50S ribosomal protein L10 [Alphaproteobacteria bacterium ADurb.Bin438]